MQSCQYLKVDVLRLYSFIAYKTMTERNLILPIEFSRILKTYILFDSDNANYTNVIERWFLAL